MENIIMTKNIRKIKTPGSKLVEHKIKHRRTKAYCKICGSVLKTNLKKKTKSSRFIARPHGTEICHVCLKNRVLAADI